MNCFLADYGYVIRTYVVHENRFTYFLFKFSNTNFIISDSSLQAHFFILNRNDIRLFYAAA